MIPNICIAIATLTFIRRKFEINSIKGLAFGKPTFNQTKCLNTVKFSSTSGLPKKRKSAQTIKNKIQSSSTQNAHVTFLIFYTPNTRRKPKTHKPAANS